MLIFEIFVSLWLNECDGYVTLQDPNFVTIGDPDVILHIKESHITRFRISQGQLYSPTIVCWNSAWFSFFLYRADPPAATPPTWKYARPRDRDTSNDEAMISAVTVSEPGR